MDKAQEPLSTTTLTRSPSFAIAAAARAMGKKLFADKDPRLQNPYPRAGGKGEARELRRRMD